jgi:hypothetical protein
MATEVASAEYALAWGRMVLGSYRYPPHDREVALKQLAIMGTGKPKALLRRMVHPETGIHTQNDSFDLNECSAWLQIRLPKAPARPALPEPEYRRPSQEQVERDIAKWEQRKAGIKEHVAAVVKARCVGRPLNWKHEEHSTDELAANLQWLEDMRGGY